MKAAVFSRTLRASEIPFIKNFIAESEKLGLTLVFEVNFYELLKKELTLIKQYETFRTHRDFHSGIEIAISIGGDGTFIETVSYVRSSGVPVVGINTGRLGFLADTNVNEFEKVLERISKKDFLIQKRNLISVTTEEDFFGEDNLAFNDVAIHKDVKTSMITVEAYLADRYINAYWADGLLVGTPTGSTAYNLSCGGPIIYPNSGVHFITPISAHNLNVRPLIVPDNIPITIKTKGRGNEFLLTLDSNSKMIPTGTEIILNKTDFNVNLIKFEESDFFTTIRNKLLWGIDQRNE
ncbi:MAG: NAD kinase [Brumimicrobium sp.]